MRWLIPLFLLIGPALVSAADSPRVAIIKQEHPSHPEESGLRLEIAASLGDVEQTDGSHPMAWAGAVLTIDCALRNISSESRTVPTATYDGADPLVRWPGWGEEMERMLFVITPPRFRGQTTAFAPSRFAPVTLAPGECVLIYHRAIWIEDRRRTELTKEVSVHFGVSKDFADTLGWWRGQLEAYQPISRSSPPTAGGH